MWYVAEGDTFPQCRGDKGDVEIAQSLENNKQRLWYVRRNEEGYQQHGPLE